MKELHRILAKKMKELIEKDDVQAATLNAVRAFLKDNEISCDIGTNDHMRDLRDKLEERKKRIRSSELTPEEKADLGNVIPMYGEGS